MKWTLKILTASMLLASMAASAEINYNYFDGLYVNTDVEDFDDNADGFGVRGSFGLGRNFHLVGSWFTREVDTPIGDFDIDRTSAGLGVHGTITENADWLLNVEYLNQDIEDISDEDGYQVTAGFRALTSEQFELDGGIRYADLDDGQTFGYLRGIYFLNDTWGLTGEIEVGEDDHSFLIGARLSW